MAGIFKFRLFYGTLRAKWERPGKVETLFFASEKLIIAARGEDAFRF
ncbi:MAG: hypothetical protein GWP10_19005 [Nitrospiraceae bacterium]|nr:hypothetical protein [Nitrospiraceae bacterium]